ncbi:MAG TPA: carboxypeptidase-like regulatory domain-containing protein [Thermoanaerobaculia bacterium]|nr:carboxypeptidase-like regulatory domain-containing protein [Thermoanaerobaculia bacterium]
MSCPRFVLLVLVSLSVSAAEVVLPDVRGGNIGGKTALLQWPASMPVDAEHDPHPLPTADGCEVHMVPHTDFNQELRYPCGKWFAPPVGRYSVWLETAGNITPNPVMTSYGASPFSGQGFAAITPVAPAGRIAIPAERSLPDGEGLRLLSIESDDWWNRGARIFDRRVSAGNAKTPVQMPAGRVIVGRFDRSTNEAIALSKPVDVKAGRTAYVWPTPPASSDVLVILEKPPELLKHGTTASRLTLDDRAPDVLLDAFEQLIAIWYGVDARRATISLKSDTAHWPPQEVRLVPGKVTTVRSRLQRLPSVEVSVIAPPDASLPTDISLEVSRPSEKTPFRRVPMAKGLATLDALPAEPLRFILKIGDWKLGRDLDLSAGIDDSVLFELQPIVISGTVFYGDEPAPAEIAFFNRGEWTTRVRTNESGQYRAQLWWSQSQSMKLTLVGRNVPAFVDAFREIFGSGTVDFHIPRTDYTVHVRDASTGRGIAGARVSAGNTWLDDESRENASAGHVLTDDDGVAVLPPLRTGDVIIEAEMEHYVRAEPIRVRVDSERHEYELALQPLRTARRVRLSLPDGSPAEQAEIWAFSAAMQPVWRGATEVDGGLEIPEIADGAWLLIRHAGAATSVRRWSVSDESVSWKLERPAEPLTLVVERSGGKQVSGAHVVLWLDDLKLSGVPLTFATWSAPATNPSGVWIGRNLPAKPIRLLALSPDAGAALATTTYDAVGHQVDYPWPARVSATTP